MEKPGFTTIVLTPTHDFHRSVGIPRSAAIEYPYGRPIGQVDDRKGQREVLLAALSCLEQTSKPGKINHLPYTWPKEPKETHWHPPEMSPIIKMYLDDIKKARSSE